MIHNVRGGSIAPSTTKPFAARQTSYHTCRIVYTAISFRVSAHFIKFVTAIRTRMHAEVALPPPLAFLPLSELVLR